MMKELLRSFASDGRVEWIGVRPARREPIRVLETAQVNENGLVGDRRQKPGKRAVTLVQFEHLPVIAALAGVDQVTPEMLRRNIVVSGINLLALRHHEIRIDDVVLRTTGPCAPCSYMQETIGPGGYNAMRGHGGLTADLLRVAKSASGLLSVPCSPTSPQQAHSKSRPPRRRAWQGPSVLRVPCERI